MHSKFYSFFSTGYQGSNPSPQVWQASAVPLSYFQSHNLNLTTQSYFKNQNHMVTWYSPTHMLVLFSILDILSIKYIQIVPVFVNFFLVGRYSFHQCRCLSLSLHMTLKWVECSHQLYHPRPKLSSQCPQVANGEPGGKTGLW